MAMEEVQTRANITEGDTKETLYHKVLYNFGDTLNDAINLYGENEVFEAYKANARIQLQNQIRSMLEDRKSPEEIDAFVSTWKVGMKQERTRRSADEIFRDRFRSASPEEQAKMLAELQAMLNK